MMKEERLIWLEPNCGHHDETTGRCWCVDAGPLACDECGAKPVAYVRAGKPTADLVTKITALRERVADLEARLSRYEAAPDEAAVETAAMIICREKCAFVGDPPCWKVDGPWPNPSCDEPGCHAIARAAITAWQRHVAEGGE